METLWLIQPSLSWLALTPKLLVGNRPRDPRGGPTFAESSLGGRQLSAGGKVSSQDPLDPPGGGADTAATVPKPLVAARAASVLPFLPLAAWIWLVPGIALGPCRPVQGGLSWTCFPDSEGPWGQSWASAPRCSQRKQNSIWPHLSCVTTHQKPAISPHLEVKWLNLAWRACGAGRLLCPSPSLMVVFFSPK